MATHHTIPELVSRAARRDKGAASALLPLVYDELRSIASQYLAAERPDHTLQPTALVHEAYLRLAGANHDWKGRAHFLAASATAMRRILVDHARKHRAAKRGGGAVNVSLSADLPAVERRDAYILDLDELIEKLARLDGRKAKVVELRFFAGMTIKEVAEALNVSTSVVDDDWAVARAWLAAQVRNEGNTR